METKPPIPPFTIETARQKVRLVFDDVAGNNFFDRSEVYRIDGWQDPARAKVVEIGALGVGFPEVIAVRGDIVYRMSDTGGSPSLMSKFRCTAGTR